MSDLATWLEPIAGDAPGGRDARHEPEHERIRAELDKLASVRGESVDWELIRRDGQTLLQHKSKDLLIAAYLAFAWATLEGLAGLARGMKLLGSLLERYPAVLLPQRPRARANALSWFAERAALLPPLQGCSAAEVRALRAAFDALEVGARGALGDDCPSLGELERSVERAALSVQPVEAPANSVPPRNEAPASTAHALDGTAPAPQAAAEVDAWLAPLAPARAGTDLSQDDAYFAVQAEIEKLQSLEGARPDWVRVRALCSELLAKRTKDFTLAGNLMLALAETEGPSGLLRGLNVLVGLLDAYWDVGFPPVQRIKRRANTLSFVFERLALALPRVAPSRTADATQIELALDVLAARLALRFPGTDAPPLSALRDALSKLPQASADPAADMQTVSHHAAAHANGLRAPAASTAASASDAAVSASGSGPVPVPASGSGPATVPGTVSVSGAVPATAAATGTGLVSASGSHALPAPGAHVPASSTSITPPTPVAAPTDISALSPFLSATASSMVEAARVLLEAEPTQPRSYRLLRIGLWLELEALPPAQGDGRTRMRAPEKRVRDALAGLVSAARWDALLLQSEATLRANPLWLDLCWLSVRALEALGETHLAAKQAVESESRALIRRLPQLLELRFLDGTPLASPETAAWLRAGSDAAKDEPVAAPKELQSALEVGLSGGDAAATRELERLLRTASCAREAFQWRLALARSVESAGKLEAAVALYLGLERDVDTYCLEDWEPDLAREVFRSLWALARRKVTLMHASEAQRICARLARLSPLALT